MCTPGAGRRGGSSLSHSHIPRTTLELLGPSLDDLWWATTCGARGFAPATTLRLARGALRALRALARARIVHNDVSPANLLMGRAGAARADVHLVDFGVATRDGARGGAGGGVDGGPRPREEDGADDDGDDDGDDGAAVDAPPTPLFVGTARFASAAALEDGARERASPAPADDLEVGGQNETERQRTFPIGSA